RPRHRRARRPRARRAQAGRDGHRRGPRDRGAASGGVTSVDRRRVSPSATYRRQIHAGFPLDDAAAVAGYLADLGVTHAYASPLLRSAAGSTHGYDTVDHAHVDEPRGGRAGFDRLVAALHEHGLGLVLDLVPNHMGVADP